MIEIIIGVYKDEAKTPEEQVKDLAILGSQFWSTTNPDAKSIEGYLPNTNTPTEYQSAINVLWLRCKMPVDYAEAFKAVWDEHGGEYSTLIHDIIFMFPEINEDGEVVYPPEPEWTEIIEIDSDTFTKNMLVGRIA